MKAFNENFLIRGFNENSYNLKSIISHLTSIEQDDKNELLCAITKSKQCHML